MRHYLITLFLIILIPFPSALAGISSASRLPFAETVLGARFANITLPYDACPVISLLQDNRGMLWLGTKRGLVCYNGHTFHLCYYTLGKSDENTIQALAQPDSGHLYAATDNGIRVLSLDTWRFEEPPMALRRLKAVRSIAVSGGKLWIGMRNDGLYAYDIVRGTLVKQSLPKGDDALMTVLCSTSDGLLIGSFAVSTATMPPSITFARCNSRVSTCHRYSVCIMTLRPTVCGLVRQGVYCATIRVPIRPKQ